MAKIYKIVLKPVVPGLIKNKTKIPAETIKPFEKRKAFYLFKLKRAK